MVIKIEKVSDDGKLRNYEFEFLAAWADHHFTLPNKQVAPALRIIKPDSREFHLTGLVDLDTVAKRVQVSNEVVICANDFDGCTIEDPIFSFRVDKAYLLTLFKKLPYRDWEDAFRNGINIDILRRTVPTPQRPRKASKAQYLKHYFEL